MTNQQTVTDVKLIAMEAKMALLETKMLLQEKAAADHKAKLEAEIDILEKQVLHLDIY